MKSIYLSIYLYIYILKDVYLSASTVNIKELYDSICTNLPIFMYIHSFSFMYACIYLGLFHIISCIMHLQGCLADSSQIWDIYIYIPHWPFLSFTYIIIEVFLVFPPKIPETMLLLCRSVLWDFHWLPQKSPGVNETFARANQRVASIATLLGSEAWQVNLSDPSFLVLGGAVVVFLYIWNETVKCPINKLGNSAHNSHNYIVFTQQRGWNCTPNYFWFPSML